MIGGQEENEPRSLTFGGLNFDIFWEIIELRFITRYLIDLINLFIMLRFRII